MDISLPINGVKLNVRVTVLLETPQGFVFQINKKGNYFPVGGRIKINENSIDAAKREMQEELNINIEKLTYKATIENFFTYEKQPVHEINIVHQARLEKFDCPKDFYVLSPAQLKTTDIRPAVIRELVLQAGTEGQHIIVKD